MNSTKLHLNWAIYRPYTYGNVQQHAPTDPGVYKLAHPNNQGELTVFYVGQAENLDGRLKEHLSQSESNECIKQKLTRGDCVFAYAVVSGRQDRDGAERTLYDYFKPGCNKVTPQGIAISINPKNS
jgi:excinuclease UvrABC nuclease subunit